MNKNIFVYANWNSEDEPSLLGILSSDIISQPLKSVYPQC